MTSRDPYVVNVERPIESIAEGAVERKESGDLVERPFHPNSNLPGCMMPDGGECCVGHAAVVDDWHKQRRELTSLRAQLAAATKALGAIADLVDSEDGEPLDDAIRIAMNSLAALTDGAKPDGAGGLISPHWIGDDGGGP